MAHKMIYQLEETAAWLKQKQVLTPTVGVVLGTGLSHLISHIKIQHTIPYTAIPNFPVSTVEFHKGHLVFGEIGNTPVMAMQGRFHYYEGYTMQEVTFPIRLMKLMGVKKLLLSNAAGGINLEFNKGDLVVINDHINMQAENPLRGMTDDYFGPRFPDMSCPYDSKLSSMLLAAGKKSGV